MSSETCKRIRLFWLCILCGLFSSVVWSQGVAITDIDSLLSDASDMLFDNPEKSLTLLRQAQDASVDAGYVHGEMKSFQLMAEAYFQQGATDSARYSIQQAISLSEAQGDIPESAINYSMLGRQCSENGEYALSISHNRKALALFSAVHDTSGMVYAYWDIGWAFSQRDMLDSAMVHSTKSLQLAEHMGDNALTGNLLNAIATIHKRMGNYPKSLEIYERAVAVAREGDHPYALLAIYNNVGILFKSMKEYTRSLDYYTLADSLAAALDNERGVMSISINRGIVLNLMGRYAEAEVEFLRGIAIAEKFNIPISLADAKTGLSRSLSHLGRRSEAITQITESIEISREVGSLEKEAEAHEVAKEIYLQENQPQQAIAHMEMEQELRDSMFQLAKARQIDEIQAQYETEKKDAEIQLLNKNVEVEAAKKKALLWIFLFALATTLSIIFALYLSRKKQKLILTREKELEQEKVRNAELELEFKQKELTAKALQLAAKNAFLYNLEMEINTLRKSSDSEASRTSRRIAEMITRDNAEEVEWELFSQEFATLHQGFLEALVEKHGNFTNMELRLIALLKMNLTTKDIAHILRISPESVKKARYRLRKKIGLDSDLNLQTYLLNL